MVLAKRYSTPSGDGGKRQDFTASHRVVEDLNA